ncbi:putative defense protein 3 [Corticium candelabrum]|uniref:putative defense protein 3 n=1 Tax=Corticium candelabrum TaxID=121492 RepID=UPI002E2603E6|nr:putative defense protein 3 [Corticium candelabrum]
MKDILCFVSVALAILVVAQSYSTGPPVNSCASMAPDPSADAHGASAQTTPPPYEVTIDVPCNGYVSSRKYRMTLRPTNRSYEIEGFLCQVRNADGSDTTAIGTFANFNPKSKAKHLACTSPKGAVTHRNEDGVHKFQAMWKAPSSIPNYNLRAFCTVVEHKDTYWLKIPSAYFTAAKNKTNNCVHGQCVALNGTTSRCRCEAGYAGPTCESIRSDASPPPRSDDCNEFVRKWAAKLDECQLLGEYKKQIVRTLSPKNTNSQDHDDDDSDDDDTSDDDTSDDDTSDDDTSDDDTSDDSDSDSDNDK